jgi:glyoxylase-like metal-dependent hydrolase (beta-lactamase superfamily II)
VISNKLLSIALCQKGEKSVQANIKHFYHKQSWTYSYVVSDPETKQCAIIDSALDFNYDTGKVSTEAADTIATYIEDEGLTVEWILETHAHADHLSGAHYLKEKLGGKIAIGEHIREVQEVFKGVFNLEKAFAVDGSQFDQLFTDGEQFSIGNLKVEVLHTPGHTPACVSYLMEGLVFVGDTVFMPDAGSARCDFPGGDAKLLFKSVKKLLALPEQTKLYMCHDYAPEEAVVGPRWVTTVGEERAYNKHVHDGISEEKFIEMRTARDKVLAMPKLILPSIQLNIRAGAFPPEEENGVSYLKLPLNQF